MILADSLSIIGAPVMPYQHCPKCGHAPLPPDQSAPAACPACGVILAKVAVARASGEAGGTGPVAAREQRATLPARMAALMFHMPHAVSKQYWFARAITLAAFVAWTLAIFAAIDARSGEAGSFILWAVLTPFHEAGHYLLFRWFGEFIMILGGTLGQHLMPLVLATALLLRRHDPFGAALFVWLFGFSLVMMAVYMYDAFDPRIMLLDGRTGADSDGHDWQNIFGDLGLLPRARGIGIFFAWAGRGVMLGSLAWAAALLWLQRARLSDNPFAEDGVDA
jgi:hypothetical protein